MYVSQVSIYQSSYFLKWGTFEKILQSILKRFFSDIFKFSQNKIFGKLHLSLLLLQLLVTYCFQSFYNNSLNFSFSCFYICIGKTLCEYPGEPINGRIVPLKFWYEPGDRLKVICEPGYVTPESVFVVCKNDGKWSIDVPRCINYTEVWI